MYKCSECNREIGAIFEMDAHHRPVPAQFKCPHTGRVAEPIVPIRR
ncbi:hypothetical protein POPTART_48 [Mycobacterium phage PopTart]|uniref:Uncharacterized protein n=2 Tax=Cheoctovirus TaxID=1623281 RepID=A0A0K1Y792_9CAUD|nr:hypothetical protein AVV07_gp055 [Mycobacterium phage Dante]YP_009214408.1 hypothetical protein POPTART_48 [Mycobacterium phage PopTart]AKY02966.1 hypothetical protein SEA_DANTE_55 [Mycobacterium phage Dante]ALA48595.1 hypothetical protein POPTART_48 [Mycobacterium phage PopTart]AQY55555.1 hypothetical protein PBI_SassyB_48 [Mycobacterium phage SassyB]